MKISYPPISATPAVRADLGPFLHKNGVTYRVWALGRTSVVVHIEKPGLPQRTFSLEAMDEPGYFSVTDPAGEAGDLYRYSIDGGAPIPDFVSHYQPRGILGPSMVVDAGAYDWQAKDWKRPRWNGHVVYECHIGTFTPEGTFRAAVEKLDHLCSLGVTAVEFMPVAEWAGERGWGYDGVMLFAPHHAYGPPHEFRALIEACHLRGLAVILDVVFNHLGPEGNFSRHYSDYFYHQAKDTQWGLNFNLDGPNSGPVRALLCQNIRYWLEEFRVDGFRMDATHAIHDSSPVHILSQVADVVHEHGGFIIAEDERNLRMILEPKEKRGWNFDALWADDFHHVVRVSQTREQESYYSMFRGTVEEIVRTLRQGWLYSGQFSTLHHQPRGTACGDFSPERFIHCISNHDQAGNRLRGDRLHHGIAPAAYRALSLFLCLTPYTPLLFMGQEWGASSPFLYFTDMPDELGAKILEGRKRELLETHFAVDSADAERMPNPQDPKTFLRSKLDWNEIQKDEHQRLLRLYRSGLKLRSMLFNRKNPARDSWIVEAQENSVMIHYKIGDRRILVCLHLQEGEKRFPDDSTVFLRSNAPEFTGKKTEKGPETIIAAI